MTEIAVIIGLVLSNDDTDTVDQNLSELEFLQRLVGQMLLSNLLKNFSHLTLALF